MTKATSGGASGIAEQMEEDITDGRSSATCGCEEVGVTQPSDDVTDTAIGGGEGVVGFVEGDGGIHIVWTWLEAVLSSSPLMAVASIGYETGSDVALIVDDGVAPRNRRHFERMMEFAGGVLTVCDELGIEPVLSGSLAVFAYTRDSTMEVHDVDLSCSEANFLRLRRALEERGIECRVKDWHVLQARQGDLKVEFDAAEHWMQDLPGRLETSVIAGLRFRMVNLTGLRELYRRGLADTIDRDDEGERSKHRAIAEKLRSLGSIR